jgi:hypothetical protein
MINYIGPINSGAAVGGNGVATANQTSVQVVTGRILGLYVKYNDSPPAGTTDVTIATAGGTAPAQTILTLTNAATDKWVYPRITPQGVTGVDLAALTVLETIPVHDKIKVTIAQANAADNVDVWLLVEN